jgi:N-formylglutamate amidohydrolase
VYNVRSRVGAPHAGRYCKESGVRAIRANENTRRKNEDKWINDIHKTKGKNEYFSAMYAHEEGAL